MLKISDEDLETEVFEEYPLNDISGSIEDSNSLTVDNSEIISAHSEVQNGVEEGEIIVRHSLYTFI